MGAAPPPKAVEKRRHRRVPVSVLIDYETADEFFHDHALNLSLGGVFIRTHQVLQVAPRLKIHFSFPEHEDFKDGWGTVVRADRSADPDEPAGMGIAFDELDERARSAIDGLVRPPPD